MSDSNWAIHDIPDLNGKIVIVTGGNSGLGFEAVKQFAVNGAEVVIACRNSLKGEEARAKVTRTTPGARISVMQLDLMSLESVNQFAELFKARYSRLDVLLNNAGIMMGPYAVTEDGFESQFATNHLGHFALTGLLIDLIAETPGARVVSVSSNAHKPGTMDFNNLQYENGKGYSPVKAYCRSKLANLHFTYELQRKFEQQHIDAMAVVAHPGLSMTNLMRYVDGKFWFFLMKPLNPFISQPAEWGALPEIRASVDPLVKGGEYYGPSGFGQLKGHPVKVASNKCSHDRELALKLWNISEELTGVSYLSGSQKYVGSLSA